MRSPRLSPRCPRSKRRPNRSPQAVKILPYRQVAALTLALLLPHPGCETNADNADVQVVDTAEVDFDDVSGSLDDKDPVDGCDWGSGAWSMKTCRNSDGFNFTVSMSGCDADIASDDDYLKNATATVQDSGMTLALESGETCHAFWDGDFLVGACSFTAQDLPCWLIAAPQ